jgi:hypothetical protein
MPAGAASRKIRPDARIRPQPACSISATTIRVAIGSARVNPVVSTTIAAAAVAMNAHKSVSTCANAPSTFRLRRCPGPGP